MVNIIKSTKHRILEQIKNTPSWISGEEISLNIGISRVAVWKQVKSLQEQGYPIESSSRGYRIESEGDYLSDLEFSSEKDILYYRELNSTMDEAVRQIELQPPEVRTFTILADHQNSGINRNEGIWDSPSGGIYMTFVFRDSLPKDSAKAMKQRGIITALNTLGSLEGLQQNSLSYSEEGGLYLEGQKIGGLLEEYQVRADRILWYALGLGIHLNDSPPSPLSSVKMHCGKKLNRVSVIKNLKQNWDLSLKSDNKKILEELENHYVKR